MNSKLKMNEWEQRMREACEVVLAARRRQLHDFGLRRLTMEQWHATLVRDLGNVSGVMLHEQAFPSHNRADYNSILLDSLKTLSANTSAFMQSIAHGES